MQLTADMGYMLHHVSITVYRQTDQALQEQLGIGLSQYRILAILSEQPSSTQRDLADYLGQTEASISRQIALLQSKHLLESWINPAERRKHPAHLTPKGIKLTQAAADIVAAQHKVLFASLPKRGSEQLADMLTTMHQHVCVPGKSMACSFYQPGRDG